MTGYIRSLISMLICMSMVVSSPGVAALIDEVSEALGIQRFPGEFSPDRIGMISRIVTGEGAYFIADTSPLWTEAPLTITELPGRKLEVRRFDLYEDPNFLSGYIASRELEKNLWGEDVERSDIWFLIRADGHTGGSIYGLEVRSLPEDAVPLSAVPVSAEMAEDIPFDEASISRAFVNSVLFNPKSAAEENFRVSIQGGKKFLLSGRAFDDVNPQSVAYLNYGVRAGQHQVLVKDALYTKPGFLNQPLDSGVRRRLLEIEPEVLISQWLVDLGQEDTRIRNIFSVAFPEALEAAKTVDMVLDKLTKEHLTHWERAFHHHFSDGGFPIHLKRGTVEHLITTLSHLKGFLEKNEEITHEALLREMDLITFLFYGHLWEGALIAQGTVEEMIGDVQPFGGLSATVASLIPHYEQGIINRHLLTVDQTFDHFLETFFCKGLDGEIPNPHLLNAVARGFVDKKPKVSSIRDSSYDNLRLLLSSPDASAEAFKFAQELGFDLHSPWHGCTLLDEALEAGDFDRVGLILSLSDEGITTQAMGQTTSIDIAASTRQINPNAEALVSRLVEKGHGKKLINSEAVVDWYLEKRTTAGPDHGFFAVLRSLALRNQQFSWRVVLEDVFPKLRLSKETIRGNLVEMLRMNLGGMRRENFNEAYELGVKHLRSLEEAGCVRDEESLDSLLVKHAIGFIEDRIASGTLSPAIYFHLTDEETHEEKIERLESCLRRIATEEDIKRYDEEKRRGLLSVEGMLLDLSRKQGSPYILTIDDALTTLEVPPRNYVAPRSPQEKLEVYLKGAGWRTLKRFLRAKLTSVEKAYFDVARIVDPKNAPLLIEGAEEGVRLIFPPVRDQLWRPDGAFLRLESQNGRRTVRRIYNPDGLLGLQGSLFVKKFPELPGMEAAARNATLSLFNSGVPHGDLFNMNEWPYHVSQGFVHPNSRLRGDLLAIKEREGEAFLRECIQRLDRESISALIISSLLLNPEDAKEDNFVFADSETGGLQLVSVDNDHILAPTVGDPVIQAENRQVRLTEVYSYLFGLGGEDYGEEGGPMDWPVHFLALFNFLENSSGDFLEKYLDGLIRVEERYIDLFARDRDTSIRRYFAERYDSSICVPFSASVANLFYDNLSRLRKTLEEFEGSRKLTHRELLEQCNPILAVGDRLSTSVHTTSSVRAMTQAYGYRSLAETLRQARALKTDMKTVSHNILQLGEELSRTKTTYEAREENTDAHRAQINRFEDYSKRGLLSQFQIVNFLKYMDMGVMETEGPDHITMRSILDSLQDPRNPISRLILQNCGLLRNEDFSTADHFYKDGPRKGSLKAGVRIFNLSNLYSLEIPGCAGVTKALVDRIAKESPSLRRLNISRLNLGDYLHYGLSGFRKLEELIMEDMTELWRLDLNLPTLKRLSLNGCCNLANWTPWYRRHFVLNCPNLEYLGLKNIRTFDDGLFDSLIAKGVISDKSHLALELEGTGVFWPELMQFFPVQEKSLFKRIKQNFDGSALFKDSVFEFEGMNTALDLGTTFKNVAYITTSLGLSVLSVFVPLVGIPLSVATGIGYGVTKSVRREQLERSLVREKSGYMALRGAMEGIAVGAEKGAVAGAGEATKAIVKAAVDNSGQTLIKSAGSGAAGFAGTAFSIYDVVRDELSRERMARKFLGIVIAKSIKENKALKKLRIPRSNLGDDGVEFIADALRESSSLLEADLSFCGIGDEGVVHLAKALKANPSLTSLKLSGNKISEAGAQELLKAFEGNTRLTYLGLEDNWTIHVLRSKIEDQTKNQISGLLQRNKYLTRDRVRIMTGARGRRTFTFTFQENVAKGVLNVLPELEIENLTAVRILFEGIETDPAVKAYVEKEIVSLREKGVPTVPVTVEEIKSHIKHAVLRGGGFLLKKEGALEALAKCMGTSFHFWVPEREELKLRYNLSLNDEADDSMDFLMAKTDTKFNQVRRLVVYAESDLSPAVLPKKGPVIASSDAEPRERRELMRYGLSIDGGGMRGLIPALMLSHLEREARIYKPTFKITDVFDYVGGTSIGGILALGLTTNRGDGNPVLSCDDSARLFTEHGRDIFGTRSGLGVGALYSKYSETPLEGILRARFGETTLAHTLKPVLITAVDMTDAPAQPSLFNSAVSSHQAWPVWQVARATSAAPTYFPFASFECPAATGRAYKFWDGGVWVNNPSHLVYENIVHLYDVQSAKRHIRVLSLGTGDVAPSYGPLAGHGAFAAIKPLLLSQMDLSAGAVDHKMGRALGYNYRRIQPVLVDEVGRPLMAELDDFKPSILDQYRDGVETVAPELDRVVEEWIRPALEISETTPFRGLRAIPRRHTAKFDDKKPFVEKGNSVEVSRVPTYDSLPAVTQSPSGASSFAAEVGVRSSWIEDRDDGDIATAKAASLKDAEEERKIGPRIIPGWDIQDVDDRGNCFYDAVADQLILHSHTFRGQTPGGTELRDRIRLCVQGEAFKDEEWADDRAVDTLVRKFPDCVLAVVDTNHPESGFTCYFVDEGEVITLLPGAGGDLPPDRVILRIAATGNHFMSVRSHPALTNGLLQAAWPAGK